FVWDCFGVLVSWSAIGGRLVGCVADVVSLVGVLKTGSSSISIMFGRESGCLKRLGDGTKLKSVDSIVCAIGDLEVFGWSIVGV
ncbi:25178_t:CDS:2, partial [Gigaspora margarita]